jgi:hypothetical protein
MTNASRPVDGIKIVSSQNPSSSSQISFDANVDQILDLIVTACEVICESFDTSSPPPKLSATTKGSVEVGRLVQLIGRVDDSLTKSALEYVEDADVLWAAVVRSLLLRDELLSIDQLASIAPETEEAVAKIPNNSLDVSVKRQRLLGALLATAEQLIARSKSIAPIVISDLIDIFIRKRDTLPARARCNAESGLQYLAIHNGIFFPFARAFYRSVQKAHPRDPVALWTAHFPVPKSPAQSQAAPLKEDSIGTDLNPGKGKQRQGKGTVLEPSRSTDEFNEEFASTAKSNWGRDSEDWDAARKRLIAKQVCTL